MSMRHVIACFAWAAIGGLPVVGFATEPQRPNILWITCEDMSADLGCYGDAYSRSPTIDRLASEGVRYTRCFTHVGVCAPSRSGLITGMYPPSIGSHHMRSTTVLPPYVKCYSELLRDAGYYCTNNSKTDYNFPVPEQAWDENSGKAHWKNRSDGKPFFAIFNLGVTHESQIRAPEKAYQNNTKRLTAEQRHDPAAAPLPPYFPDTPIVRQDVARYYDNITAMDYQTADLLKELDDAGLADDTIVFFYSDHGAGLPRSKRWLYDSSLHVPLIVRYPKKWQTDATKAGAVNEELVAFVDLGPTALSLAGVEVPKHMQGQAFLGPHKAATPREYVYGCRDRMDERVDMIRSVRDKQYQYIRNYQWWKPYAQNINYMNEMPTMQEWRRLAAAGKLNAAQSLFMAPQKPREELYDCDADPHEVNNLAADPKYAEVLKRLRTAHDKWTVEIRDLGYLPEHVLHEYMDEGKNWRDESDAWKVSHALRVLQDFVESQGSPYSKALRGDVPWPREVKEANEDGFKSVRSQCIALRLAELASGDPASLVDLKNDTENLSGAPLFLSLGVANSLIDSYSASSTDIPATTWNWIRPRLQEGLRSDKVYLRHAAALAVDDLGQQAVEFLDDIRAMMRIDNGYAARVGEYILKTRDKK